MSSRQNKSFSNIRIIVARRHRVIGRVLAFQTGGPGLTLDGVKNFNFYSGTGCVSFVCVVSFVFSGGDPDIVQTTHSGRPAIVFLSRVQVRSLLLPLQTEYVRDMAKCNIYKCK